MKKILLSICFAVTVFITHAQHTIKITKPINKKDWVELEKKYFAQAYGTASVINDEGIVEVVMGDRPVNPQDRVSWRPPPIPPKDNPDNPPGVKKNTVKLGKTKSVKPKPIDPGCPTCSIFIFSKNVSTDFVNEVQSILKQYN